MDLIIIRHGIAKDRDRFAATGEPDDLRPLTRKGRRRMRKNARGLCAIIPTLDLLATSPLVRAVQTAEIVANVYGIAIGETVESLRPDAELAVFARWANGHAGIGSVGIVGHDPHLSKLITWLASGSDAPSVTIEKGGAALIRFTKRVSAGKGCLVWLQPADALAAQRP